MYLKIILTHWPAVILIIFIFILFRHKNAIDTLIRNIKSLGPSGADFYPPGPPDAKTGTILEGKNDSEKDSIQSRASNTKKGVALVSYKIASVLPNSIEFKFLEEFKVWFLLVNHDPKKYLAYIKIKFITADFEEESTSGYYNGSIAWKLNVYSGIQAPGLGFSEKIRSAAKDGKTIKIEIGCEVHDDLDRFIEKKLPQTYVYDSAKNSWYLEP